MTDQTWEPKPFEPGSYAREMEHQAKRRDFIVERLRHWDGVDPIYGREAADIIERQAKLIATWEKRVEELAGAVCEAQAALRKVIDAND